MRVSIRYTRIVHTFCAQVESNVDGYTVYRTLCVIALIGAVISFSMSSAKMRIIKSHKEKHKTNPPIK